MCLLLALAAVPMVGCESGSRSPYAADREVTRNPELARELNAKATQAMKDNPAEAERLLRDALTADLYHGPAHNNLGILLLARGDLYEAAGEFEWARKLMPGHPDPRVNLALALERGGQINEALIAYDAALEVYPNYLPALQGKSMLQVANGLVDDSTRDAVEEIAMRGDAEWREWAQKMQLRIER